MKVKDKLIILDFDDTLAKTDCKIKVLNKGLALSTKEWVKYNYCPDEDEYDFSEFRGYLINPRPTNFLLKRVPKLLANGSDVLILTSRIGKKAIEEFLKDYIKKPIKIVEGAFRPKDKRKKIESLLKKYNSIEFYDDSHKNVKAVKDIRNPKIIAKVVRG